MIGAVQTSSCALIHGYVQDKTVVCHPEVLKLHDGISWFLSLLYSPRNSYRSGIRLFLQTHDKNQLVLDSIPPETM